MQPSATAEDISQTDLAKTGLTSTEAVRLAQAGKSNVNTNVQTKSVPQILAEHTFTFFNGLMLALGILVLTTGELRNALFVFPALLNIVIGAFQEIRSKHAIDKLSVLAAKQAHVIRDGKEQLLNIEDIVLGDCVVLGRGDQVPADARVLEGSAHVNESLLTGESVAIEKHVGDELLSGSFLDAGSVSCEVIRVGQDGYAAKINAGAKRVRKENSEILAALRSVIRIASIVMIPLGVALFARTMGLSGDYKDAVLSSISAVVGMIPQGLVLLTSSVFAIAATRLASKNVLVQQLYCTEKLARVDVLCLDKTGTITSGAMRVSELRPATGVSESELKGVLSALMEAAGRDENETSKSIRSWLGDTKPIDEPTRFISFSSDTKFSGCETAHSSYVLGAAQFIFGESFSGIEEDLKRFGPMDRVLAIARVSGFSEDGLIEGTPELLGYLAIQDEIRSTAKETVSYFVAQGVDLKVISGDDPRTVSHIAQEVGIPHAELFVDATTLTSPVELAEASRNYQVFGRVTPEQKRELLRALQADGHIVAMTGDGVNDVLALRESDCSIAMASGSDAARNVSELVLVDNDFSHMPEVVAQGRQSINNLERSASLFLVKTVFSALLALVCAVWPPYPFLPVQMTLLSAAVIGVPSFVLALEPNHERVKGRFMRKVLARSLPASAAIVLCVCTTILVSRLLGWSEGADSTISMYLVAAVGIALIIRISEPLNPFRGALIIVVLAMVVLGTTIFGDFFSVVNLEPIMWAFFVLCACIGLVAFHFGFEALSWVFRDGED